MKEYIVVKYNLGPYYITQIDYSSTTFLPIPIAIAPRNVKSNTAILIVLVDLEEWSAMRE